MSVTPARAAALDVLRATSRGRHLDVAFREAVTSLDARDRRWVHEAAYGTVRWRGRLDHLLDHHLRRGVSSVEPTVLEILRLGAYQLLHMDSVPDYAAVSQAVETARGVGSGRLASLVNGVLRTVARAGEDEALFPDPDADPVGHLATWGSHPAWLVERWLERWTYPEVRALVDADNRVPPVYLALLEGAPEEAVGALAEKGVDARPVEGVTRCVELSPGTDPREALREVRAVVQDPAARLVTTYAAPPGEGVMADLCAAPGGKALALAAEGPYVFAADRSAARLELVRENARRTGMSLALAVADAEHPPVTDADLVLLDVPCSGTGTLRRNPDLRWRLEPEDLPALTGLQDRMLDGGAEAVSSGGVLVYSTCTLEPEENEGRIESFLERRPDFRMEPTESVDPELLDGEGRLTVLPWRTGFDGAFAARLRRV